MAINYTEKELMEMQNKAIIQARDMHRRAYLVSPETQNISPRAETARQVIDYENHDTKLERSHSENNPVQPAPRTQNNTVMPAQDEIPPKRQNNDSYSEPQQQARNLHLQNGPGRNRTGARLGDSVRPAVQPPDRNKPSQNISNASRVTPGQNEPMHSPSPPLKVNKPAKSEPVDEEPFPPPMRPQSRPLLNLGGLFNSGFKNYPPPKEIFKHEEENSQQTDFCPKDCPVKKSFDTGFLGNMQGMDNDMMLILGLIMLLSNEGSDQMLIFALLYILM